MYSVHRRAPAPLEPHLVTVLLYDPQAKVRTAAAQCIGKLLSGSRTTLEQAIYTSSSYSFKSLFQSFGSIVLELHECLFYALEKERDSVCIVSQLKVCGMFDV